MSNQPVDGDFRMRGRVAEVFYQGEWKSCDLRSPYERGRADMLEQVIKYLENERTFEGKQRSHKDFRKWGIKKRWRKY